MLQRINTHDQITLKRDRLSNGRPGKSNAPQPRHRSLNVNATEDDDESLLLPPDHDVRRHRMRCSLLLGPERLSKHPQQSCRRSWRRLTLVDQHSKRDKRRRELLRVPVIWQDLARPSTLLVVLQPAVTTLITRQGTLFIYI